MIFSKQSWKKKLKKIEKKCIKSELLDASDMTWTCPKHVRTCPGHGKTHEDSYGFLKIQNRTKTQQNTDIFVLQIAEQTFQICSHFPTKAASKIEPLCSQDLTGHMWSNRGFWKVRIWQKYRRICTETCNSATNEFDGNPIHWETLSAMESPILYT